MFNKVKPYMVVILALSGLALLICSQAWAEQPPKSQEIVFSDGAGNNHIKVKFDQQGEAKFVYFWDDDCAQNDPNPACWLQQTAKQGIICTCVDGDSECSDNLYDNLNNPDVTLDCHDIKKAGPTLTGCPLLGSRSYVAGDGSAFVLPRGR